MIAEALLLVSNHYKDNLYNLSSISNKDIKYLHMTYQMWINNNLHNLLTYSKTVYKMIQHMKSHKKYYNCFQSVKIMLYTLKMKIVWVQMILKVLII